jgi:hypothetical protein
MNYKTPQEAIAACEAENERAWNEYVKMSNLSPDKAPDAFAAAKAIFRAGYMSGARFITGAILKQLTQNEHLIVEPAP